MTQSTILLDPDATSDRKTSIRDMANQSYQPHEFAKRAGVTIRALHHYDRLGLLKPSGHTAAGYRLYTDRDLVRLEQIVALKFIGFSLSQIRELLNQKDLDLVAALRQQRPESEAGLRLAQRKQKLIELFAGGDPGIAANLKKLCEDKANWPQNFKKPLSDEVDRFLCEAVKGLEKVAVG